MKLCLYQHTRALKYNRSSAKAVKQEGITLIQIPPSKGEHRTGNVIKQDCTLISSVRETEMGILGSDGYGYPLVIPAEAGI